MADERDELQAEFLGLEETRLRERFELETEIALLRARVSEIVEEGRRRDGALGEALGLVRSAKGILGRIGDEVGGDGLEQRCDLGDGFDEILSDEAGVVHRMSLKLEGKVKEWKETRRKERRQFESSIASLVKENGDVNNLLRVALAEKVTVEKRMKVVGEHSWVAILQVAGRGLQNFGLGFLMRGESDSDQLSSKSNQSKCEEEVVSLVSRVETMMKNLHQEISNLKHSLDESRSERESLQILVNQQADEITKRTLYIRELEKRENALAHNVEELSGKINEAEEEVVRWREACELEVEAGKSVIESREKEIAILRQELGMTKSAFDAVNSKIMLKEKLAATAMAARAAAETSLQLADSRYAVLRERIEELRKQMEEAECSKNEQSGSIMKKLRHVFCPWLARAYQANGSVLLLGPE